MLNHPVRRLLDAVFLRFSGGDVIRADELRTRCTATFLAFVMASYVPLFVAVAFLVLHRPQPVDEVAQRDQMTMVEAYATRYVDAYLKDPSNAQTLKQFYDGEVPPSVLPAGGRALRVSSALPGLVADGFQTYSVVVDAEIPKAANARSMVNLGLQVDVSADLRNHLRAFTLPHVRPDRPSGQSVQLATQTSVSEGRPVYRTVSDFLAAMLCGVGDVTPYVAQGSTLTAARPARFSTMAVERVQTNSDLATAQDVPPKADGIEVTVRTVMQTANGVQMPMDFPLVMSVAAGHWQIDRINDAPTITPPSQTGSGSPTTTTTPSTTSTSTTKTTPRSSYSITPEGN